MAKLGLAEFSFNPMLRDRLINRPSLDMGTKMSDALRFQNKVLTDQRCSMARILGSVLSFLYVSAAGNRAHGTILIEQNVSNPGFLES